MIAPVPGPRRHIHLVCAQVDPQVRQVEFGGQPARPGLGQKVDCDAPRRRYCSPQIHARVYPSRPKAIYPSSRRHYPCLHPHLLSRAVLLLSVAMLVPPVRKVAVATMIALINRCVNAAHTNQMRSECAEHIRIQMCLQQGPCTHANDGYVHACTPFGDAQDHGSQLRAH